MWGLQGLKISPELVESFEQENDVIRITFLNDFKRVTLAVT